jgi:hypothetical protein
MERPAANRLQQVRQSREIEAWGLVVHLQIEGQARLS